MSEERDPYLNEEEDTIMKYSREEHLRKCFEDYEDKSHIHSLMWDVYTREKDKWIKRDF